MNKEELLQELSSKVRSGEIQSEEVMSRLKLAPAAKKQVSGNGTAFPMNVSVTKMLYILGAAIVVIGIVIFVAQIWDDIGSFGRILVTLGLGLLFAFIGSTQLKQKPEDAIGAVFHCMGGLLIPGGAIVTLSEMSTSIDSLWPVTITFGGIFAFYCLLNSIHKNAVLTFFAIANGTAFVYLLVESIVDGMDEDLYAYLTMVVGACYLLLGHSFRGGWNKILIGILYFLGITAFLGAAFSRVFDSGFWQMLYFVLIVGSYYLAVFLRSRSILVMSTIFLIAHVSYITSEYFADSIGWPITLVVLGFIFIGLGYVSFHLNRKYIAA